MELPLNEQTKEGTTLAVAAKISLHNRDIDATRAFDPSNGDHADCEVSFAAVQPPEPMYRLADPEKRANFRVGSTRTESAG